MIGQVLCLRPKIELHGFGQSEGLAKSHIHFYELGTVEYAAAQSSEALKRRAACAVGGVSEEGASCIGAKTRARAGNYARRNSRDGAADTVVVREDSVGRA